MSKIALVLEGGALRGIFSAGVVDCFLDHDISFDYVCGVSAGACNTLSYVSKHKGFFKKCVMQTERKDYFFGIRQMSKSHKFLDLDKIFYDYTTRYNFSYEDFIHSDTKWEMVVTNIETGKAEYMTSKKVNDVRRIGTASCSMPILTKPVRINNKLYLDGGMADSVPIQHTLDLGYDKVVVICTRKKGSYSKIHSSEKPIYNKLYKDYPNFIKTVNERTKLYKKQIALTEKLEDEGKVILIRPTFLEVGRLESNLDELSLAYYHGYTKAKEYVDKIKNW